MGSVRRALALVAPLIIAVRPTLAAQLEPPSTGGAVALEHELRMLGHYKRVLLIGAHPDDEDTELLTILVRGQGAEAAYLSLNRGEGGQNLIGTELGEALGLLRTEELLAARRLDGAQQYFTRAFDFGFSKTLEDTWSHWPQDTVLKDVVRIVRRFRPQIIVSIFSGTPRDGHGQHQAAGWAAQEAFWVSGDSSRFPELDREEGLAAWSPIKLYRSTRFDTVATTLTLDGGVLDPAVGQSFLQISMRGRSLHRSQDMGQLQHMGQSLVRLQLLADRTTRGEGGLFAGVDTTLGAMPGATGSENGTLAWERFAALVDSARALAWRPPDGRLADVLAQAAKVIDPGKGEALPPEWGEQQLHLQRARATALGLMFDAVADRGRVVPGDSLRVTLTAWNTSKETRKVRLDLAVPMGWKTSVPLPSGSQVAEIQPGALATTAIQVSIPDTVIPRTPNHPIAPDSVQPTTPYFLRQPRVGAMYTWPPSARVSWGEPFEAPYLIGWFVDGEDGSLVTREVVSRTNDQALGEVRSPLTIVTRVDVKLDPQTEVWPTGLQSAHTFSVTLTHGAADTTAGRVWLEVPPGWPAVVPVPFTLTRAGEERTIDFRLRPPPGLRPGTFEIRAIAKDAAGRTYGTGSFTIAYPHIRSRTYVRPALATVTTAPLVVPHLTRVGYVRGAADVVPEALRSVGVPVEMLNGSALERGDLGRYDAIVIGPRAYETEPALPAANGRLLTYARNGGLLVVQYQQYAFFTGGYAPFPLTVASRAPGTTANAAAATAATVPTRPGVPTALLGGHDRVTDENAPVRPVLPVHRVLQMPNRLGPQDWDGWVQERGLYFARSWDPAYRTVIETHDPGEGPLEGGLLIARLGRGTYVYTGLSFFRQLPAGVPGAYRLFANLLALPAESVNSER